MLAPRVILHHACAQGGTRWRQRVCTFRGLLESALLGSCWRLVLKARSRRLLRFSFCALHPPQSLRLPDLVRQRCAANYLRLALGVARLAVLSTRAVYEPKLAFFHSIAKSCAAGRVAPRLCVALGRSRLSFLQRFACASQAPARRVLSVCFHWIVC